MANYIAISAIDAVIGGTEIQLGGVYLELKDSASGFDGPGSYHVQLQLSTGKYLVTYGQHPGDSSDLIRICGASVTPDGKISLSDRRPLNVNVAGVNATILQTAVGGSYLASGIIVPRNFAPGTLTALLDGIGAVEGDILYRGATVWEALGPSTAGYLLATGGSGAAPAWVAPGSGVTIGSGTAFPGSPSAGLPFYRTDLGALFLYIGSSWVNADSLSQLNDVAITSLANGQVLAWNATASKWENVALSTGGIVSIGTTFPGSPAAGQLFFRSDLKALFLYTGSAWQSADAIAQLNDVTLTSLATDNVLYWNGSAWVNVTLSALIDAAIGNTRGAILERGASGWALIAPGTSGYVLTSNGSSADPSWQAAGGGGGVSSIESLTGAVGVTSPDGSVNIGTSGSNLTLEATGGVLPLVTGESPPALIDDTLGQTIGVAIPYTCRIPEYLGAGLYADIPASPNVPPNATAFYLATDSGNSYIWTGSSWSLI